jgi:type I restriction enzyme S subunit
VRWIETRMEEIAEINPKRPTSISKLPDDHLVTFVPMTAVSAQFGAISDPETVPLANVKRGFTFFKEGDVIFAKITPSMQNGKSAIAHKLDNGIGFGSTEFHIIRPNTKKILPEWLHFFVRQRSFLQEGTRHFRGAVGQQRIPPDFLAKSTIPFPDSLKEQRRIVARIKECMARVDEIEALRGESVAESEALLPSMLNEVFVGLFQKYVRVEIGEVAEETRYGTSLKCNTNADGMPILRIPNVAGGFVNYENLKHCPLDEKERQRIKLNAGDLLFVRTNGSKNLVGRCAVYEGQVAADFGFASYLIRVRFKKARVLPHFLAFFLNSTHGRQEIDKRRRTSAGQFNINSENLRSIELPLPPIEIQESIVSELRERQREINVMQHEVQEAKLHEDQLRESILRKAFAGEL